MFSSEDTHIDSHLIRLSLPQSQPTHSRRKHALASLHIELMNKHSWTHRSHTYIYIRFYGYIFIYNRAVQLDSRTTLSRSELSLSNAAYTVCVDCRVCLLSVRIKCIYAVLYESVGRPPFFVYEPTSECSRIWT